MNEDHCQDLTYIEYDNEELGPPPREHKSKEMESLKIRTFLWCIMEDFNLNILFIHIVIIIIMIYIHASPSVLLGHSLS